jgi:hypothetical protein
MHRGVSLGDIVSDMRILRIGVSNNMSMRSQVCCCSNAVGSPSFEQLHSPTVEVLMDRIIQVETAPRIQLILKVGPSHRMCHVGSGPTRVRSAAVATILGSRGQWI